MVSRSTRFNLYLLVGIALLALTGCQSPEAKRKRQLATCRGYLEVAVGRPGQSQVVTVLRSSPMTLTVEKNPFLNEIHVASAEIVDTPGGFVLSIRMNKKGTWLLEQYTSSHPNRRIAIRCQWGVSPDVQDRFLAAKLITGRIKDGVLTFTPDASREEVEQIVIGLNNYAGDTWLKEKSSNPDADGGKK